MLAAILLFGVALIAAQDPRPCRSPTEFQGRSYTSDYSKNFTRFERFSYDETNKRIRRTEEREEGSTREFYDTLYLYNENKEYRVNLQDRKCNITAPRRSFVPFGVPPDARYDGESNIGPVNIPNEHVTVIRFEGKDSEGGEYRGTVSSPDCVPVAMDYYSNKTGLIRESYYDITIGIPDPSVFEIPSECRQ